MTELTAEQRKACESLIAIHKSLGDTDATRLLFHDLFEAYLALEKSRDEWKADCMAYVDAKAKVEKQRDALAELIRELCAGVRNCEGPSIRSVEQRLAEIMESEG